MPNNSVESLAGGLEITRMCGTVEDRRRRQQTRVVARQNLRAWAAALHPGADVAGSPAHTDAAAWLREMVDALGLRIADDDIVPDSPAAPAPREPFTPRRRTGRCPVCHDDNVLLTAGGVITEHPATVRGQRVLAVRCGGYLRYPEGTPA